jgi:hypothetical protein
MLSVICKRARVVVDARARRDAKVKVPVVRISLSVIETELLNFYKVTAEADR